MWNHRLKSKLNYIKQIIYPHYCHICGIIDDQHLGICEQCKHVLPDCEIVCEICGLPILGTNKSLVCGRCQKRKPYFDRLLAPFWYQAPFDQLITQFKYHQRWQNAELLMKLFYDNYRGDYNGDIVIPMPSHPLRIRERGCNAVYELLRILTPMLKLSCDFNHLQRIKYTDLQANKNDQFRRRNIKNAFSVSTTKKYKKVILFDDVVTTTATINEASKCLRQSGVKEIEVWALARTKLVASNCK